MCKTHVLVVVYNKSLTECAVFASLSGIKDVDVFVADNSTRDMGNERLALEAGYKYIGMGGNKGLSRAYNRVIDGIEKNGDLICLFDDDTMIGQDYFETLKAECKRFADIDLFAPVVTDAAGMLSPCEFKGVRARRVNRITQIPQNNISVINSGLAIRTKIFAHYRYDENQFLDYVDHAFIRDIIAHDKSKIRIMDVTIQQQFSASQKQSRQDAMRRYGIFKKDVRYFGNKYGAAKWKILLLLARRRAKLFFN